MKVDPELRSLWVISTIYETYEGSADASETGQYAGSGSRLQIPMPYKLFSYPNL